MAVVFHAGKSGISAAGVKGSPYDPFAIETALLNARRDFVIGVLCITALVLCVVHEIWLTNRYRPRMTDPRRPLGEELDVV